MLLIKRAIRSDFFGGILLIFSILLSLYMVSSPHKDSYYEFLNTSVVCKVWNLRIDKPLLIWINEGLMSIFFLTVSLEIKKEFLKKESLRSKSRLILPIFSAIGGTVVPIIIYLAFNFSNKIAIKGWAIPATTDIAFAVGVISIFGNRVSKELRAFLLALATIDDLIIIFIISIFYSQFISISHLLFSIFPISILFFMNRCKIKNVLLYLSFGIILWYFLLVAGIQASISGVIIGLMIPYRKNVQKYSSCPTSIEKIFHRLVIYFILPIFAFSNSGIDLTKLISDETSIIFSTVSVGIVFALVIGKPTGIFLSVLTMLKLNFVKLPKKISLNQIFSISVLCGISFTMSIFIAGITFDQNFESFLNCSRIGIFIGSWISAILGAVLLGFTLPKKINSSI
ncbi:Na+/H+ antiporter NhaA [Candidatus Riesia pediculicola]|uniref:Na(+)/H(+) antiporter NhaA n=1 Tax=Riesia pediculicola (strain USDA) TaxID=515618 RepID=D4G8X4_RIEPU|nr:Na+/H+ antiporter NhaA [Candidatus Riesia pediculicola]ADD79452.1 Na+/H+ antiporter NhaA [Candidatus Riesia pediculicola USDA]ARC53984.1 hypothetical protein AOE55_02425 [Candidatus Riesia pediculicola]QOJ86610.1 Na+/H+ antiporter NhaA [Candidatus Riesia pediculicola]